MTEFEESRVNEISKIMIDYLKTVPHSSANDMINNSGNEPEFSFPQTVFYILNKLKKEGAILRDEGWKTDGISKFATYTINPDYKNA